jgi:hypothetical protein
MYPLGAFDPKTFINISWRQNHPHQATEIWAKGWDKGDYVLYL